MFQLGIARKAQPLERLGRHFKEFQQRMLHAPVQEMSHESTEPLEPVLVDRSEPSRRTQELAPRSKTTKSSAAKSKKFQVFQDTGADEPRAEDLLPTASSSNAWTDYGNEAIRVKENTREATVWSNATLPQKSSRVPPTQKFPVFKDDEEAGF